MQIIKKNGLHVDFDGDKIKSAIRKSADRVMVKLTDEQERQVVCIVGCECAKYQLLMQDDTPVAEVHKMVEKALRQVAPEVAEAYANYRNYKTTFVAMMDEVYKKTQSIMYLGDKENSNADSSLVSTKQSLIRGEVSKELYKTFFLTDEERQAIEDGFIYIHDMRDRLFSMNCCLADISNIMSGGFEMGNIWYNEPKSLDTAFDVLGDIVMSMASQEYGGYTIPQVDDILEPYCHKSYGKYVAEYTEIVCEVDGGFDSNKAHEYAIKKVKRDLEQGFQGLEIKLNSVASSRGDYPFTTITFGTNTSEFGLMISEAVLKVRENGQGKDGFKKVLPFPKLVFLYTEELHGEGKPYEWLFDCAVRCSSKAMYPDYLSLDSGATGEIYQKYGKVISPMGCRAYLSNWFERGGAYPEDENDTPVYIGRFNIGAITLNLCMIYQEARVTGQSFYTLLDYYLEMIRGLHIRTYSYLANLKASTNSLGFTQGGFYKGNLDYNDKIGLDMLKPMTASFGFTALNELTLLHEGCTLRETNEFAKEVMEHINERVQQYKEEDGWLYAVYATPAESLVGLQVQQFKKRFGAIEGIFDKDYVSNGFHLHVSEDVSPFEKQDKEEELFHMCNGGHITYTRYYTQYNYDAMKATIRRGMAKGFYQGVNLSLATCNSCGYDGIDFKVCPKCGSEDLVTIDRMNGYLSYTKVNGESRLNDAKMAEIDDRKSM